MLPINILLSGAALLLLPAALSAAELRTEHIYALVEGESHPEATLDDAHWLVGSWSGTAFGKRFEEVWNAPSAASMVGMFKLFDEDGVSMYELMALTMEEGTLSLKIRHFDADFTAWEERTEDVTLKLVKKDDDELHFGTISFYRRSDDHIDAYILFQNGEDIFEQPIVYKRHRSH